MRAMSSVAAVKRADARDVERRRLLEKRLHLHAELADDAEVVATRLAVPSLGIDLVVCAELAEAVGGEKRLRRRVVADDDFGPVHHRRADERKRVPAEVERVAFLDDDAAVGEIGAEVVLHDRERLHGRDDLRIRVRLCKARDVRGVVGLHVVDDEIVDLVGRGCDVLQPLVAEARVDRIHHGDFLAFDYIGIVGHAERNLELAFEEIDVVVVDADIENVIGNLHSRDIISYNSASAAT